jgi:hypothetical protein
MILTAKILHFILLQLSSEFLSCLILSFERFYCHFKQSMNISSLSMNDHNICLFATQKYLFSQTMTFLNDYVTFGSIQSIALSHFTEKT